MIKYQDVICTNDFQVEVSLVLGNRQLMYFRVNSELAGGGGREAFGIILCRADIFGVSPGYPLGSPTRSCEANHAFLYPSLCRTGAQATSIARARDPAVRLPFTGKAKGVACFR